MPATGPRRLLRGLAELGLVERSGDRIYHPTQRGRYLQRAHPNSLSDAALMWAGETWDAWSGITQALRTGLPEFKTSHGRGVFEHLDKHPGELWEYHRAMAAYARHDYSSLSRFMEFGALERILDAGGGTGELAFSLLRSFPGLAATVMDRPEVVDAAVVPEDVAGRCSFVAGDLFQRWPATADAVVLARVLHDWADAGAAMILDRAREAMPEGGCLYVVEMVVDDTPSGGLLDLNMLVTTGGMERPADHYEKLLGHAGFRMVGIVKTGGVSSVIRARAI